MKKAFLILMGFLLILTGCGPIYRTTYSYVPPANERGKMCVIQCQTSKKMCENLCEAKNSECTYRERDKAHFEYESYVRKQEMEHQPVLRDLDSFYNRSACSQFSCGCEEDYRSCYQLCGGQVVEHRECVAFCNKAQ